MFPEERPHSAPQNRYAMDENKIIVALVFRVRDFTIRRKRASTKRVVFFWPSFVDFVCTTQWYQWKMASCSVALQVFPAELTACPCDVEHSPISLVNAFARLAITFVASENPVPSMARESTSGGVPVSSARLHGES
jgi:hypothetical protein